MENQLILGCESTSLGAAKKESETVLSTASLPGLQGQKKPQNHTMKELQTLRLCCDKIKILPQHSLVMKEEEQP